MKNNNQEIDFVITWVDSSDPKWNTLRKKYSTHNNEQIDNSETRFRDWGLLRYWFRAVEENAPWVRSIHFVTCGQTPNWLNTNHPKIRIVNHESFMEGVFLPTFNSCAIEANLHRIPGLSEQFVYFNDDMFLNQPTSPTLFFENGRPKASYILTKTSNKDQANKIRYNCNMIASKYRKHHCNQLSVKNGLLLALRNASLSLKKSSVFCSKHAPAAYLRRTYQTVWAIEPNLLEKVSGHRFRSDSDCSQWLFEYFQLYTGLSIPRKYTTSKYYDISQNSTEAIYDIENSTHTMICINDTTENIANKDILQSSICMAFEKRYPHLSSFEKGHQ